MRGFPLICLLTLAACAFCQAGVPDPPRRIQGLGVSASYLPADFKGCKVTLVKRLTAQENGDAMPVLVGPRRVRLSFVHRWPRALAPEPRLPSEGSCIQVIPLEDPTVPDFAKAYPNLAAAAAALKRTLAERPARVAPFTTLPDLYNVMGGQSLHARIQYLDTPLCTGIAFINQYAQEFTPLQNADLSYSIQALTRDGKYYLAALFSITHPDLPYRGDAPEPPNPKALNEYMVRAEDQLNGYSSGSFFPSLDHLRKILTSLTIKPAKVGAPTRSAGGD